MGMEGKLRQVSEFELATYKKNPVEFYARLVKRHDLHALSELNERLKQVQQSRLGQKIRQRALSGLEPVPQDIAELQRQMQHAMDQSPGAQAAISSHRIGISNDGTHLSLHKSWHCLHFLLTGKSWEPAEPPLANAIMGGTELPDKGRVMGYGPARYLTPPQVGEVADALANFPVEEKAAKFDPHVAAEQKVYVPNHDQEELLYFIKLLRDFYQDAAGKRNAMILWVE